MSDTKYHKNKYIVKNKNKYMGSNIDNVIYRSSWEKKVFEFLDNNNKILGWRSEPLKIPYLKPDPNYSGGYRQAFYFPDLYVEYIDVNNKFQKELIEIKPAKYTRPSRSKNVQTRLYENYQFSVNTAKWERAMQWCKRKDINFRIMTEKSIYGYK